MVSVQELKEKYSVRDIAPYGSCIIVPGDEFDPDWEDQLCAQGHKVFMTSLDGKALTLVKVEEDKKDLAGNLQSRVWSEDNVEFFDAEFSNCCFCKEKYGSPVCWNCPEYDGPVPGEEEDEE